MTQKEKVPALAAPRPDTNAVVGNLREYSQSQPAAQASPSQVLAGILREARMKAGVSAEQLAADLDLPLHVIALWESGMGVSRFNAAIRWAAALGFRMELVREVAR